MTHHKFGDARLPGAMVRTEDPPDTATASRRLTRIAICTGIATVLLSLTLGAVAYSSSRQALLVLASQQNLATSNTVANQVRSRLALDPSADPVALVKQIWEETVPPVPGAYLCVVDADGCLALHTSNPKMIGTDVSQVIADEGAANGPLPVAELIRLRRPLATINHNFRGLQQAAGYAPFTPLNGLLVTHLPVSRIDEQIAASALPWAITLGTLVGVLFPVALTLQHRAFRTESQRASRMFTGLQAHKTRLAEEYDELTALYRSAPVGLCLLDPDHRFVRVNQALAEIHGLLPEAHLGRSLQEVAPEIAEQITPLLDNVIATGEPLHDFELTRPAAEPDRPPEYFRASLFPLPGPDGAVNGVSCVVQEITRQTLALRELAASEARYRQLVQQAPVCIHEISLDGRLVSMNPAGLCMLGVPDEAAVSGTEYLSAVSQVDKARIQGLLEKSVRGETTRFTFDMPDGQSFESCFIPLYNEAGKVTRLMGISQDVTERLRTERDLRQSELLFRTVFEQAAVGVALVDSPTGVLLRVNRRYAEIIGIPAEELVGRTWVEHTHEDDIAGAAANTRQLLLGKIQNFSMEKRLLRPDGTSIWVNLTVSAMWGRGQCPTTHIAVIQDISDRKRAETSLRRRDRILSTVSRLSEQFLQNADWQRALRAALAELGLTTRASRASVFMVTEDPSKKLVASLHSEWTEVGVTPQMPNPAWENLDLQSAGLGRWIDELSAGRVIHDRIHNLPEPEQQALSDRGVVSLCVLPVRSANRLLGFLAFEDCHRSRIWSDTEVHTLRVAAETLSAAVRRSEADKRLRISEMRFRSLVTSSAATVWSTDAAGSFVAPQPMWETFTGQTFSEYSGWGWASAIHPDDVKRMTSSWRTAVESGDNFLEEGRIYHAETGAHRYCEFRATAIKNEAGQVLEWIGTTIDIHDRRAAAIRAKEQHEATVVVLSSMLDGYILADVEGQLLEVNPAYCRMIGYTRDELLQMNIRQLEGNLAPEEVDRRIEAIRAHGRLRFETVHQHRDGHAVELDVSITVVPPPSGSTQPPHIAAFVRDITEQNKAQADLRLRDHAFATSTNGIVIADARDPDLPLVYCNPAFETLTGYSRDEVLGRNCRFLQGTDLEQSGRLAIREALRAGRAHSATLRNYRKDGSMFWTELRISPVHDKDGQLTHFLGFQTDVTARKKAELALRESESRFRMLCDQAPVGIFMNDADGKCVYLNEACARLLGQVSCDGWLDMISDEDQERVRQAWNHSATDGLEFSAEFRLQQPDGAVTWIRSDATARRIGDSLAGSIGTMVDISANKLSEIALRHSERRFRRLVDSLPHIVWVCDTSMQCVHVNRQWAEFTGRPPEDAYGDEWSSTIHPSDRARLSQIFETAFESGEAYSCEVRIQAADKSYRWFIDQATPWFDENGDFAGYVGSSVDITERKRAELDVLESRTQLEFHLAEVERARRELQLRQEAISRSPTPTAFGDAEFRVTYVNNAFVELFGLESVDAVIGQANTSLVDDPAIAAEVNETIRRTGEWKGEISTRTLDGRRLTLVLHASLMCDDNGLPMASVMTCWDITDRKLVEDQLRFTQFSVDACSSSIFWIRQDGKFFYVNDFACRKFGYSAEQMLELSVMELDPNYTESAWPELWREVEQRRSMVFESEIRHREGHLVPVEITTHLLHYHGDDFVFAFVTDITARKRAELQLSGEKAILEKLASGGDTDLLLGELVSFVEQQGGDLICSVLRLDKTGQRLQHAAGARLPRAYVEAIDGVSIGENVGSCGSAAYLNQTVIVEDISTDSRWAAFRDLARESGLAACWSEPLHASSGRVLGTLAMYFQTPRAPSPEHLSLIHRAANLASIILERQHANDALRMREQQLRSMVKQLSEAEERERRRVSRILHDQLAPTLAASQMRLSALRTTCDEQQKILEEVWQTLEECSQQARSLAVETSPPVLYELGLGPAIEWLVERFREQHGIACEVSVDGRAEAVDQNTLAPLFQSTRELLLNAARHGQPKSVQVSVEQVADRLVIQVRDDGHGFEPNDLSEDRLKAAGFGLFGIRDRFQLLGGRVDVQSTPGKGTCVTLHAPLRSHPDHQ